MAGRDSPSLGGVGIDDELDQVEDPIEFVGLSEVVERPIATDGRGAEIGERSVPDLSHDGTEAVKSEVEACPTLGEEGPATYYVYTDP